MQTAHYLLNEAVKAFNAIPSQPYDGDVTTTYQLAAKIEHFLRVEAVLAHARTVGRDAVKVDAAIHAYIKEHFGHFCAEDQDDILTQVRKRL